MASAFNFPPKRLQTKENAAKQIKSSNVKSEVNDAGTQRTLVLQHFSKCTIGKSGFPNSILLKTAQ